MHKVLLVFEDFNELTLTESYLKKIGFDVLGSSNELLIQDKILTFNPDVIVANGNNSKVSSFSVGQKLKEYARFRGKVLLVLPAGARITPSEMIKMKVDAMLEAPLDPTRLIQSLCRLLSVAPDLMLEKLQKAKLSDPALDNKMRIITNTEADKMVVHPAIEDKTRIEKYEKFTKDVFIDTHATSHNRAELKEKLKDLKKGYNYDLLEELDALKRKFAEALFRKK